MWQEIFYPILYTIIPLPPPSDYVTHQITYIKMLFKIYYASTLLFAQASFPTPGQKTQDYTSRVRTCLWGGGRYTTNPKCLTWNGERPKKHDLSTFETLYILYFSVCIVFHWQTSSPHISTATWCNGRSTWSTISSRWCCSFPIRPTRWGKKLTDTTNCRNSYYPAAISS